MASMVLSILVVMNCIPAFMIVLEFQIWVNLLLLKMEKKKILMSIQEKFQVSQPHTKGQLTVDMQVHMHKVKWDGVMRI